MLSKPQRLYDLPSPPFVPVKIVGLAILIENYDKTPHKNLKEVRSDAVRVLEFFQRIGIKNEDTTVMFDVTNQEAEELVT